MLQRHLKLLKEENGGITVTENMCTHIYDWKDVGLLQVIHNAELKKIRK